MSLGNTETNNVPREHSVAAVLLLLFIVLISLVSVLNLLYFYISTFRSMCAVPNMAVFWSSLNPCFPGVLLVHFLNDFDYYYYYYYHRHHHHHHHHLLLLLLLYAGYLYVHSWENYVPMEYGVAAILLLLFMVSYIFSFSVESFVFLHQYFSKYVCSAQYGCFLLFLDFMFSWYVAHVFSEWLWNSPSRSYYYWYHLCFYISHALYFYCKVFIF